MRQAVVLCHCLNPERLTGSGAQCRRGVLHNRNGIRKPGNLT
jgi:hypothetical protein